MAQTNEMNVSDNTHTYPMQSLSSGQKQTKKLLHVGCGPAGREATHHRFHPPEWEHIRVDIDSRVQPDVVADIRTLEGIADDSVDGVYSSHNLEHLHYNDVFAALKAFHRVLKDRGHLVIVVPNFELACDRVSAGRGLETLYVSPAGPITALDMIFGYRPMTYDNQYMCHRTGFTQNWLRNLLIDQGFMAVETCETEAFDLWAFGRKMA